MRRAIREQGLRWNRRWRELGARRRAANPQEESKFQETLGSLRREGRELRREGGELDSNPDGEPPRPPTSRPASEHRSDRVPEQDRRHERDPNKRRCSIDPNPKNQALSNRSGSAEGSSGPSENPPPSDPPSYQSGAPSYHTNASTATNLPTYVEQPTLQQRLDMQEARRRRDDPFDRQRGILPRR